VPATFSVCAPSRANSMLTVIPAPRIAVRSSWSIVSSSSWITALDKDNSRTGVAPNCGMDVVERPSEGIDLDDGVKTPLGGESFMRDWLESFSGKSRPAPWVRNCWYGVRRFSSGRATLWSARPARSELFPVVSVNACSSDVRFVTHSLSDRCRLAWRRRANTAMRIRIKKTPSDESTTAIMIPRFE